MIRNSHFHCWRNSQTLVNSAEIVMHIVERHGVCMILDLLGKAIGEPCKAAHGHTHRQVLALPKLVETCFGSGLP